MRRVNEGVREVVSSALTGHARDKLAGFVTITEVSTSPDLHNATVYVSVFGSEKESAATFEALEELRIELQREIAAHMRMKYTPILKFENDDSVDNAMHINELINEEAEHFDERSR
jgi:ribosome-binding factor A